MPLVEKKKKMPKSIPSGLEKDTIVIYSKYYSVFEPYYSKVYYTVYFKL